MKIEMKQFLVTANGANTRFMTHIQHNYDFSLEMTISEFKSIIYEF